MTLITLQVTFTTFFQEELFLESFLGFIIEQKRESQSVSLRLLEQSTFDQDFLELTEHSSLDIFLVLQEYLVVDQTFQIHILVETK